MEECELEQSKNLMLEHRLFVFDCKEGFDYFKVNIMPIKSDLYLYSLEP